MRRIGRPEPKWLKELRKKGGEYSVDDIVRLTGKSPRSIRGTMQNREVKFTEISVENTNLKKKLYIFSDD